MIAPEYITYMVACTLRTPTLFMQAADKLLPAHFTQKGEELVGFLWSVALDHYREYKELLPKLLMRPKLLEMLIRMNLDTLDEAELEVAVDNLLTVVYETPAEEFSEDYGQNLLQTFFQERVVLPSIRSASHSDITDLPKLISNMGQLCSTYQLGLPELFNPFDMTRGYKNELPLRLTNYLPFDRLTQGMRATDFIGLLGPIGGGKSLNGINLACTLASSWKERVIYFTYEQSKDQLKPRFINHLANIHRSELEKQYDQWSEDTRKRVTSVSKEIGDLISISDMQAGAAGMNGVADIDAVLYRAKALGRHPAMIVVDFLGEMVTRYMRSHKTDFGDTRHVYQQIVSELNSISDKYKCAVLLLHQLNAAAGQKKADSQSSQYAAAEFSMFPVLMDTLITVNAKDPATNLTKIGSPKCRGKSFEQSIWCRIDPDYHQVHVEDKEYSYVYAGGGQRLEANDSVVASLPVGPPVTPKSGKLS